LLPSNSWIINVEPANIGQHADGDLRPPWANLAALIEHRTAHRLIADADLTSNLYER
jgi:hypothetical protein